MIELTVQVMNLQVIPGKRIKRGCAQGTRCEPVCGGVTQSCGTEVVQAPKNVWHAEAKAQQPAHRRSLKIRRWERLIQYGPTSGPGCSGSCSLFNDTAHKTHCGRVFQGTLDNAYFVEALNAISLRPKLARRLFYAWSIDFS